MHYLRAGTNKHSVMNIFTSKLNAGRLLDFTTTTNGSPRAMVPTGNYEEVMPLDILPTAVAALPHRRRHRDGQKLGAPRTRRGRPGAMHLRVRR